ncbi:MAG: NrfD/PsrC family molybdoenzyme membrane anchor subunit [Solirubrobacteraceae bacterium]
MVPRAQPRSYYGQPIIKEPVWSPEIAWYLFVGGLAGASAPLAWLADAQGNRRLARRAWLVALLGAMISPVLLVNDLGRPERFLNMLRLLKVTSPMSMGSWILSGFGTATGLAVAHELLGRFQRLGRTAKASSALLGHGLASYTAILLADTAVPVWHEAAGELPFVFVGSAAASAAGAAAVLVPVADAGPARRLALLGAVLEQAATYRMERRLGDVGEPYHQDDAGRYAKAAKVLTTAGTLTLAGLGARRRSAAIGGGVMLLSGSVFLRWSVFRAGFASAADPKYVVNLQRQRMVQREADEPGKYPDSAGAAAC